MRVFDVVSGTLLRWDNSVTAFFSPAEGGEEACRTILELLFFELRCVLCAIQSPPLCLVLL